MANLQNWVRLGREHWKEFQPTMYKRLLAKGTLDEKLQEAANKTFEDVMDLEHKGYQPDEAWQMVRERYLLLPEEKGIDTSEQTHDHSHFGEIEAAKPSRVSHKLYPEDIAYANQIAEEPLRANNKKTSTIDPELLIDGMTLAAAYIEAGIYSFPDFATRMVEDLGDKIKPYLMSFWEGARYYPSLNTSGMTGKKKSLKHFMEINQCVTPSMIDAVLSKDGTDSPDVLRAHSNNMSDEAFTTNALNTSKQYYWQPKTVNDHLKTTLAVTTSEGHVTQQTYRNHLYSKISWLLNQQDRLAENGEDSSTKEILQMSVEHLPEFYTIAEYEHRLNWADAILNSDTLGALTRQIDWMLESTEIQESQQQAIMEAMEEESLMSFLEHF